MRIGDVAVIDAQPAELPNGRLTSRALDNRLGSYVALEAARLVAEAGGAQWELAAVAAAQEEITFGGSRTSAFALEPDAAIVVDVTHATDAPGIDVKESGKHELGSGPVLSRGSTLNQALFELLFETAEAEKIPFTVEASARATGTDADAVHLSRGGVPTALVSIPIRYMHSPGRARPARRRPRLRAPDRGRRACAWTARPRPALAEGAEALSSVNAGTFYRPRRGAAERQHAQALGPGVDLAPRRRADAHERVAVEVDPLAFDLDPAGAAERQVDLLLAVSAWSCSG